MVFSLALSWGRLPWSALPLESSHRQWVFSPSRGEQPWSMRLLPFPWRAAMVNGSSTIPLENSHGLNGLLFSSVLGKASMVFFTSLGEQPWTMGLLPLPWRTPWSMGLLPFPWRTALVNGLLFSSVLGKASMVCTSLGE